MCQYGNVVRHLLTARVYQRFNLREPLQDLIQSSLKQCMGENVCVCFNGGSFTNYAIANTVSDIN